MSLNMETVRTDKPDQGGPRYAPGMALPGADTHRVLRNTYLLLALTMIPTIVGAYVGMATGAVLVVHPMASTLIMLGAVIGLQYAIIANRNSALGAALLLLMTGILGWWLGPSSPRPMLSCVNTKMVGMCDMAAILMAGRQ